MSRPKWQIEVPMSYLTPEELEEVAEKTSATMGPEEALEVIEEAATFYDFEIAFKLRNLHLAGVRITLQLASQLVSPTKEKDKDE